MRIRTTSAGRMLRVALLASSAGLAATSWSAPALAQDGSTAEENESAAIVVTGSRIQRRDYTATSPIVTVDSELVEKSSSVNLEANLNKLPQFAPALTQFGPPEGRGDINSTATNTPGATTISLRQLGANRNVVLVDGRRPTPINGTGVVDINSIPSAAIERVEIITGGASSTYGADAVAGVTNFILKKNYQGFTVDGQYGISQEGDGQEFRVSSLIGASFDDGRGNVILGMERYDRKQVKQFDRKAFRNLYADPNTLGNTIFGFEQTYFLFPTEGGRPAGTGNPSQTLLNSMFQAKGAPVNQPNGTALNIPFAGGIYLNDDNTLFLNTSNGSGTNYVPLLTGYTGEVDGTRRKMTAGGNLRDNYIDQMLSTPTNRWSFFAKGEYEITPWLKAFSQVSFVRTQVFTRNLVPPAITSWSVLIPNGDGVFLGDRTLNFTAGADGIPGNNDDQPLVGAVNLGIPSSLLANGNTHPDYLPGGRYGLSCPATGGCPINTVYPKPAELQAVLNSRGAVVNGNFVSGANQPFQVNYFLNELGERILDNRNTSFQVMAGFEGTIPGTDWTWEVYGSHGETAAKSDQYNFASVLRWRAVMSSPNYGKGFTYKGNSGPPGAGFQGATGTCASGVNPFDSVPWTQDCKNAVTTNLQTENKNTQDILEANLQGGLFNLPYGQLRFALGASYKKNTIDFHPDGQSTEGTSFLEPVNGIYPQGATKGDITAKEIYGELLVPLLSDMPFVHELNLELGYRLSDYSIQTVGSVSTWKINGEWAPTRWLRFRGGYQKASRAPNLAELFTAATSTLGTSADGDPCSRANPANPVGIGNYSANPIGMNSELQPDSSDSVGNPDAAKVEALCRQIMGSEGANTYYTAGRTYSAVTAGFGFPQLLGNEFLKQEDAKTYTIGGVITSPSDNPWLRRFSLAVDYYNIQLTNAIAQQSIDGVYRRCFAKQYNPTYTLNEFCALVGRTPGTGEVATVSITYSNAGRVETAGIDAQVNWGLNFEDAGIGLPGSFSTSVTATYLLKFATTTDDGIIPLIDYAGSLGPPIGAVGTNSGAYRWRLFSTFTYALGPVTATLQWQHKPSIRSLASVTDLASQITGAPAYNLFNLNATVAVTDHAVLRFGVDNLFNKQPPLITRNLAATSQAGNLIGGTYDTGQYDVLGRRFYIGANVKF